jgi:hypothetical protein
MVRTAHQLLELAHRVEWLKSASGSPADVPIPNASKLREELCEDRFLCNAEVRLDAARRVTEPALGQNGE